MNENENRTVFHQMLTHPDLVGPGLSDFTHFLAELLWFNGISEMTGEVWCTLLENQKALKENLQHFKNQERVYLDGVVRGVATKNAAVIRISALRYCGQQGYYDEVLTDLHTPNKKDKTDFECKRIARDFESLEKFVAFNQRLIDEQQNQTRTITLSDMIVHSIVWMAEKASRQREYHRQVAFLNDPLASIKPDSLLTYKTLLCGFLGIKPSENITEDLKEHLNKSSTYIGASSAQGSAFSEAYHEQTLEGMSLTGIMPALSDLYEEMFLYYKKNPYSREIKEEDFFDYMNTVLHEKLITIEETLEDLKKSPAFQSLFIILEDYQYCLKFFLTLIDKNNKNYSKRKEEIFFSSLMEHIIEDCEFRAAFKANALYKLGFSFFCVASLNTLIDDFFLFLDDRKRNAISKYKINEKKRKHKEKRKSRRAGRDVSGSLSETEYCFTGLSELDETSESGSTRVSFSSDGTLSEEGEISESGSTRASFSSDGTLSEEGETSENGSTRVSFSSDEAASSDASFSFDDDDSSDEEEKDEEKTAVKILTGEEITANDFTGIFFQKPARYAIPEKKRSESSIPSPPQSIVVIPRDRKSQLDDNDKIRALYKRSKQPYRLTIGDVEEIVTLLAGPDAYHEEKGVIKVLISPTNPVLSQFVQLPPGKPVTVSDHHKHDKCGQRNGQRAVAGVFAQNLRKGLEKIGLTWDVMKQLIEPRTSPQLKPTLK